MVVDAPGRTGRGRALGYHGFGLYANACGLKVHGINVFVTSYVVCHSVMDLSVLISSQLKDFRKMLSLLLL